MGCGGATKWETGGVGVASQVLPLGLQKGSFNHAERGAGTTSFEAVLMREP